MANASGLFWQNVVCMAFDGLESASFGKRGLKFFVSFYRIIDTSRGFFMPCIFQKIFERSNGR